MSSPYVFVQALYLMALFHSAVRCLTAESLCYLPNGTQIEGYSACNQNAKVSHCCKNSDVCISNGYCFQQGAQQADWGLRLARSSCTDRSFNSAECPQYCKDVSPGNDMPLILVNNSAVGKFCCSEGLKSNSNRCIISTLGSNKPFELEVGQVVWDRSNGDTNVHESGNASGTKSTTTSPSVRSSPATDSHKASPATSSPEVSPTANNNGTGSAETKKENETNTTTIVAAVAASLGALLLLATIAAILFWRRTRNLKRRNQRALVEAKTSSPRLYRQPTHEIGAADVYEASPTAQLYEARSMQNTSRVPQSRPIEVDGTSHVEVYGTPVDHNYHGMLK